MLGGHCVSALAPFNCRCLSFTTFSFVIFETFRSLIAQKLRKEDIATYFAREVLPHVPDAWIDASKTKIGYEIPFNRYFYRYTPPRALEEIDGELQTLGREIMELLAEVAA